MRSKLPTILGLLMAAGMAVAADPPDLAGYRTVDQAIAARVSLAAPKGKTALPGYLGVRIQQEPDGRLTVAEVQPGAPADRAGLRKGDVIQRLDGKPVIRVEEFRERIQEHAPDDTVRIVVLRQGQPQELAATVAPTSRPLKADGQRAFLGVALGEGKEGDGFAIERLSPNSPAASAGLKAGDIVVRLNDTPLRGNDHVAELLSNRQPGEPITLVIRRDGKELKLNFPLGGMVETRFGTRSAVGAPAPEPWKKELFRLGVVLVEFPDIKHDPRNTPEAWQSALFSRGTHVKTATGEEARGSLNDYYLEQSCGGLRIEGKVFPWIEVGKKRGDYSQGSGTSNRTVLLTEALDRLLTRDGKDALKDLDGLFFVYAGERVATNRGALYYPHAGSFNHQGQRRSYFISPEGGGRMTPLAGYAREFAFVLGLPDLAARTENAGSEGVGPWCLMGGMASGGRPPHLSAWCKEQLGWLKPTAIDPRVKQRLVLSPVEESAKECFKVLVRADGSEYLLLENRRKKGFDAELPGEGLLIWRVLDNRPELLESHGVEGPAGPRAHLSAVPWPSDANRSLTPLTTPSSRSPRGGGLAVHLTDIRRLPDGRIAFQVGLEFQ